MKFSESKFNGPKQLAWDIAGKEANYNKRKFNLNKKETELNRRVNYRRYLRDKESFKESINQFMCKK